MKKIHPIYFSSKKHFPYLLISLKSLFKLGITNIGNIYLYIDENDFINKDDEVELSNMSSKIILRKTKNITHTGEKLIISELKAFDEVSREIDKDDYIAKTDSDIIFLNNDIFNKVLNSEMVLIGFEIDEFILTFTQGGLYFIKSDFIQNIIDFDKSILIEIKDNFVDRQNNRKIIIGDNYPEDVVIYSIIRKKTDKILFIPFMYIPGINKTKNPSVIHFMHTKFLMKYYIYMGDIILIFVYFFKPILYKKIGQFLKYRIPFIYKILKLYLPDK